MVAEQLLNDPALFARATAIGANNECPSAEELVDEYLAHCGWAAKEVWKTMGKRWKHD